MHNKVTQPYIHVSCNFKIFRLMRWAPPSVLLLWSCASVRGGPADSHIRPLLSGDITAACIPCCPLLGSVLQALALMLILIFCFLCLDLVTSSSGFLYTFFFFAIIVHLHGSVSPQHLWCQGFLISLSDVCHKAGS